MRRKRMKRPARLQAARHWIPTFTGKRIVRGYAQWFGVDLLCALEELQLLGVELAPEYVAALRTALQNRSTQRTRHEPARDPIDDDGGHGSEWDDDFSFIAGFTSGGAPFGLAWEEWDGGPCGSGGSA